MEQHLLNTAAAIMTIAIFSFLWRDNPLYRFAEHLVVGVSAGYWIVILWNTSLVSKLVQPIGRVMTGTSTTMLDALVIVPAILGLMLFSRFTPNHAWISRIPMAYILGVGSGAAVPLGLQTSVVQQIYPTMMMFLPGSLTTARAWFDAIFVLVGVMCGLIYFYFSARHEGAIAGLSKTGIWILMIGFGASFGYTVMSRVSLLYGRMIFLVDDWARPIIGAIF
jgi:hypothetical protein